MPPAADLMERYGLRLFTPEAALIKVPEAFFSRYPVESQVVLSAIRDASDILGRLLDGGHSAVAGRLAGGFRRMNRREVPEVSPQIPPLRVSRRAGRREYSRPIVPVARRHGPGPPRPLCSAPPSATAEPGTGASRRGVYHCTDAAARAAPCALPPSRSARAGLPPAKRSAPARRPCGGVNHHRGAIAGHCGFWSRFLVRDLLQDIGFGEEGRQTAAYRGVVLC